MALTRMRLGLGALVVVVVAAGAAFLLFAPGEGNRPLIQFEEARNTLSIEAAGVQYAGWPEMDVHVNGESIGTILVDKQQRSQYTIDVPNDLDPVSTVEIKIANASFCQNLGTGSCKIRQIIVRGVQLNDTKLENPVASGEDNSTFVVQTSPGGIAWNVDGGASDQASNE